MPAVKMKAMSTTTCKRKGSYPHESLKSNKICKAPSSMVRETHEMENLAISSQTSYDGFAAIEEFSNEHDDEKNYDDEKNLMSSNIDIIDGQTCLPVNAGSIEERDSLLFSHPPSSDTMMSDFNRPNDGHCNQLETVTREQISMAPQVDENNLPNFQIPDMLDSYSCEMFLNGFSIDGINIFGDNLFGDGHNSSLSDLEFFATNLICDLPTLEDTIEAADYHYGGSCEELPQMPDPSWFQLICHQAKPIEELDVKFSQLDSAKVDYSDPEAFIRNILDLSDESNSLPGLVSEETGNMKHITLVLDLDETLVHSTMVPCDGADFTIQIFLDKEHTVYVRQRPFLQTFLEEVSEKFEIIIFTASKKLYADKLLDVLDPEKKFFSRRLYRDSCILEDSIYTKDLTVLGIDLAKVFIVDNSPQVYRLQVDNGIPIVSWYEDPSDTALMSLLPFLEELADVDDVRPIIAQKFGARNK